MPSTIRGSDNLDSNELIGKGGTAVDVTSQIVSGTPRTNNSGRPLSVYITIGAADADIEIEGFLVFNFDTSPSITTRQCMTIIVGEGETYTITSASIIQVIER